MYPSKKNINASMVVLATVNGKTGNKFTKVRIGDKDNKEQLALFVTEAAVSFIGAELARTLWNNLISQD